MIRRMSILGNRINFWRRIGTCIAKYLGCHGIVCHIFITDLVPDFTQPSETKAQKERFQGTFETHAAHPIYRDNIGPITLSLKSDIVLGGWRTEDSG